MDQPITPEYEDRPSPGWGLLALNAVFFIGMTALLVVKGGLFRDGNIWSGMLLMEALICAIVLFMVISAYNTHYRISSRELELRSGPFHGRVMLGDILSVKWVKLVLNKKGFGITLYSRGFCNRYSNCLRLTMSQGKDIYLSPSDPADFTRRLGRPLL